MRTPWTASALQARPRALAALDMALPTPAADHAREQLNFTSIIARVDSKTLSPDQSAEQFDQLVRRLRGPSRSDITTAA